MDEVNGDRLLELITVEAPAMAPVQADPAGDVANAARNYSAKGVEVAAEPEPYVADADGDGKDDLVIMRGMGGGRFVAVSRYLSRPRFFYGVAATSATTDAAMRFGGRGRAMRPTASESALRMQLRSECIDEISDRLNFSRDGVFGRSQAR